jgi:mannose-1-phosphate guanylyltransferase
MLGKAEGTHVFSGIYCVNPDFLKLLPPHEKVSVIPAFLELARRGDLGAVVLDEGLWLDLGDREAYLQAHAELALAPAIHPGAMVHPAALIVDSVIGPGAEVAAGAVIRNSVLWPEVRVESGADLAACVVYSDKPVSGIHRNEDW